MKLGGTGGANTTKSGRTLEEKVKDKIIIKDNNCIDLTPYEYDKKVKKIVHRQFCTRFFTHFNIPKPSKNEFNDLNPDNVFYNSITNSLECIEVKNQNDTGSTDEKIQTGIYKVWWLLRLFRVYRKKELSSIKYTYMLADKFKDKKYAPIYEFYNYYQAKYKELKEKYDENEYSDLFELWKLIDAVSFQFYSDIEDKDIIIE